MILEVIKMDQQTISVPVPPDLYAELGSIPLYHGKLKQKLLISLAIGMYVSKEISLARAAEYADMAIWDFVELLNSYTVPVVDYTEDMLEDDLAFAIGSY